MSRRKITDEERDLFRQSFDAAIPIGAAALAPAPKRAKPLIAGETGLDGRTDAMVKPWMRTWMTDHPPTELHADFLNIAHADIRVATMNSKAWSEASTNAEQDPSGLGLYWSPIDPDVYAVGFDRVHVRPSPPVGAPKSSHMAASYPR